MSKKKVPVSAATSTPSLDNDTLARIAAALERLAPPQPPAFDDKAADAYVWHADPAPGWLEPVPVINAVPISLLRGVDRVRDILLDNTQRFAKGLPANNALLWGARGMGKSSLVKAVLGAINAKKARALALVEIHREDIPTLPQLLKLLRASKRRYILFCDDLSFDAEDQHYKSLKAVLEGGIEGRPDNVIFYATSNRRHLLPRDMVENERSTAINPGEAVEEKVSLSDRFGLWLGFHSCSQEDYFAMLDAYCATYGLKIDQKQLRAEAVEWAMTRGSRSGRVAWQFIQDLAGRLGKPLTPRSSA
ncbi:ATP-binding protein [uncultured Ferrovibrio sp.]|jgi:predicted AAA+ superfamily ATPase|uniref:ATP-binding protein n=1 Tax=uncultured Ferrovibrio sp. TaxID=1576913 RepID=UPI00262D55C9|nr:ATP-binding protein [uncultured Ferrovibrio sp.]